MGRNFANKLWNASRLVLLASEGVEAQRSDADQVDRWITSRFQRCVAGVEAAVTVFDFTAAVHTLYHFVWDEFCDWYLEMVKPRLYSEDAAVKAQAGGHARWVLEQIVNLLHPFMPFVTEEIAAQYGAAPLLAQSYPARDEAAVSAADEEAVARVQGAVNALRAYRAEAKVAPAKVLTATFVADAAGSGNNAGSAELFGAYSEVFRTLARTEVTSAAPLVVSSGGEEAAGAEPGEAAAGASVIGGAEANIVLVPGGRFELQAAVNRDEEIARLQAQLAKVEAEVERGEKKLSNENFVSRAAPDVVARERAKLADYTADRDELAARLAQLLG
jgi:valyl-tRNA synthetase